MVSFSTFLNWRGRNPFCASSFLVLTSLAAPLALHADVTASILGTVSDANHGVVPNVEVVATNLETNLHQTVRSDNIGEYRILALPVGRYKIEASASASRGS